MLYYRKIGSGKPVFLVHGFPNDGSSWDSILPFLSKNYQYIIPDLPGAGNSEVIADLTLEKMAFCLKEILDAEQIDQALFAGHSMGGYTIMEATQHFQNNICGISLVHSLAGADNAEKKEARRKSIKLLLSGDAGKNVFLKAMGDNLFGADFKFQHAEIVASIAEKGSNLPATTLAAFYESIMHRTDKVAWLKSNTKIAMQWIIGDEDNATTMKEALEQCYLASINDVQLYRGVGHMSMLENPERLAVDLNQFFDFVWNKK